MGQVGQSRPAASGAAGRKTCVDMAAGNTTDDADDMDAADDADSADDEDAADKADDVGGVDGAGGRSCEPHPPRRSSNWLPWLGRCLQHIVPRLGEPRLGIEPGTSDLRRSYGNGSFGVVEPNRFGSLFSSPLFSLLGRSQNEKVVAGFLEICFALFRRLVDCFCISFSLW